MSVRERHKSDREPGRFDRVYSRVAAWAHRFDVERKLAIALLLAALLCGVATYVAISGSFGVQLERETIRLLFLLDLVILLAFGAVVARQLVGLALERRRGLAGSRLHARLVLLFSLLVAAPVVVMAIVSTLVLDRGVDDLINDRVRRAIYGFSLVSGAYVEEHQRNIALDALAMAADLRRDSSLLEDGTQHAEQVMRGHVRLRGLSEATLLTGQRAPLVQVALNEPYSFDIEVTDSNLQRAAAGELMVMLGTAQDRVRALVRIDPDKDLYLLVGRLVDPRVIQSLSSASDAVALYDGLEERRSVLLTAFLIIFLLVAVLMLLAAVWLALIVATRLARPIGDLVTAAEQISTGDLTARVAEGGVGDEIGTLSRAFNRMTGQLQSQRAELVATNEELDERRRLTELVLSGVSAGVIGLDSEARIRLPNRSAAELLGVNLLQHRGKPLAETVPEMAPLIEQASKRPGRFADGEIAIVRGSESRTLLVRVVGAQDESDEVRIVVTFDDVTELLSAQRKAAWADVARRIAHEIKNPLTPIQLSAERLKRKYLKEITSDPETFAICTDTIVRQVGDIGRMVDEFSAFARMPAPVLKQESLNEICRQALFLQQSAGAGPAKFNAELGIEAIYTVCDARQVGQALTNLLKNAQEAIEGRETESSAALPAGEVWLKLALDDGRPTITVADNGKGLPTAGRERLTEPYVTTRTKGTGLGLAIVKKIMEDHGGQLQLNDRDGGGAVVRLIFAASEAALERREAR